MKQKQSGFTLIEIAIVLVIIGLLLGGVLKGQELINSAKVKNLATDFKNIPVFIYGYQDKFRSIPGDDGLAASHVTGATEASTPTTGLNGTACVPGAGNAGCVANGVLDGFWNSTTVTDESVLFWQHVRLAGLAPGATTPGVEGYMPVNAVGGEIGIQGGTSNTTNTPITGGGVAIRGSYVICSAGILGKFAKQLDTQMDDGNTASGSMMAGVATATGTAMTAVASLGDADTYTVCMGI
ncbi:MAG: prepilin-type N-terminal cleavage/methylation domain-containing protein [Gammaproteobacteria bacterium]|nr:prepilin-type N-terminal cleavage/methylation domain-containing protein [Sideroxydans sp.]MBU3903035.1 prepilin-type N-terminal cleavage/methylation domain-containing protein [Gammaproteobacteria bacterium]MBU4045822.1 prepilin-type N-terminal cleavage/methylation domain-containing protein [Gammaproteobacteria bacterium]